MNKFTASVCAAAFQIGMLMLLRGALLNTEIVTAGCGLTAGLYLVAAVLLIVASVVIYGQARMLSKK